MIASIEHKNQTYKVNIYEANLLARQKYLCKGCKGLQKMIEEKIEEKVEISEVIFK